VSPDAEEEDELELDEDEVRLDLLCTRRPLWLDGGGGVRDRCVISTRFGATLE
jgi:hypothetical protein